MSNLADLKTHLSRLSFVQVKVVVVKDDDVIAFEDEYGVTIWHDDPEFLREREKFSREEWKKARRSCRHYYGYTQAEDVYFQMSNHEYQADNMTCLGVGTLQNRGMAPMKGDWLVGQIVGTDRKKLFRWAICTEQERQFAYLLLGKISVKDSSDESLQFLKVERSSEQGVSTMRLIHMARLLIIGDIEYYLKERLQGKAMMVDSNVLRICGDYSPELWAEYENKAREQRVYSSVIPEPAPLPIHDNLTGVGQTVPLLTPFGNLKI